MTLKRYLSQFDKEQLIAQILELNTKYKDVKSYYKFSLNPDLNDEKEKVKQAVYECCILTMPFITVSLQCMMQHQNL